MLLLWWCPFQIQKEKWLGLLFTMTVFFSLALIPLINRWTIPICKCKTARNSYALYTCPKLRLKYTAKLWQDVFKLTLHICTRITDVAAVFVGPVLPYGEPTTGIVGKDVKIGRLCIDRGQEIVVKIGVKRLWWSYWVWRTSFLKCFQGPFVCCPISPSTTRLLLAPTVIKPVQNSFSLSCGPWENAC
jgi:hypothetical protein